MSSLKNTLKTTLTYGVVSLATVGLLSSQCYQRIAVNPQRIQRQSGDSCYTQIDSTDYYLETVKLSPAEDLVETCRRGDKMSKVASKYLYHHELSQMNRNQEDDFAELKIISTREFLEYFSSFGQ